MTGDAPGTSRPRPGGEPRATCPLVRSGDRECPDQSCGNSARVYNAHIEALDTTGQAALAGLGAPYYLERGSLRDAGGGCRGRSGLSLEVRAEALREYTYGHGIFAQLLDDLEDVEQDCQAGRLTIYSESVDRESVDALATIAPSTLGVKS